MKTTNTPTGEKPSMSGMKTSELAFIDVSTLDHLFRGKSIGEVVDFKNIRYVACGESVNVKVQKTSGG